MKFSKELKWIYCLFKCSKYLYFAKKILCGVTIAVMAVTAVTLLGSNKNMKKALSGMIG